MAHAADFPSRSSISFALRGLKRGKGQPSAELCQTSQCAAITYGDLLELDSCSWSGASGIRAKNRLFAPTANNRARRANRSCRASAAPSDSTARLDRDLSVAWTRFLQRGPCVG